MKNQQTAIEELDPLTAKNQWFEAIEAHKIAGLRVQRCQAEVEAHEAAIRSAAENEPIAGEVAANMEALCRDLAASMKALDAAELDKAAKASKLRLAWQGWQPFAFAKAQEVPRMNRVGVLQREANRVTGGVNPNATPRVRDPVARPVAEHASVKARRAKDAAT